MSDGPWSDNDNDLTVADYFAMLEEERAGRRLNKSEHRRELCARIGRPETAIEYKHRNISAILQSAGETRIAGYKPLFNYQRSLEDAVARWLALHPDWVERPPVWDAAMRIGGTAGFAEFPTLLFRAAPTLTNQAQPKEAEQAEATARRFGAAERDERNRALGRAGEEMALEHERAALRTVGRDDLARRVDWTSQTRGDGAGYDIESFEQDGRPRLIEVKTTRGWNRTPFHISRNELRVSEARRDAWVLMRLHDIDRKPGAFELRPPLENHVSLIATSYRAEFG
ncbi:protein of unknown function [Albimonas donghaensis]|uniref:Protein NO VEIN C-terminal domain-containing protein n=1 Tax=Albimonas donghaensis TaxID=356660 RepID=A0A1H3AN86_9RHOB|nr:DUF3883 domain-containing protein [Albimonas donghaensis]SDX31065.1 protein of unknown function [Albimonas donghaensis]